MQADHVRHVRVVDGPLDVEATRRAVTDPRAGAVVVFTGMTRSVPMLKYEAYEQMATKVIRHIAQGAVVRHGAIAAAVEHRVGDVLLSEESVVVAVSAAHRQEAFAAAREIIDSLKEQAPVFKYEIGEHGGHWVSGSVPTAE